MLFQLRKIMENNQIVYFGIPYSFKRKMQKVKNKLFNF